uniref:Uncharacterized protein n=1 Tax=Arundo donax TaxID=35708 RepID=A0A0A9AG60_ARUDO
MCAHISIHVLIRDEKARVLNSGTRISSDLPARF